MRKRKKPKGTFKLVRVDERTVIEVDINKPDIDAVRDYQDRVSHSRESTYSYGNKRKHIKQ